MLIRNAVMAGMLLVAAVSAREYQREDLEQKQAGFKKMRTAGITMGIAGVSMIALGAVLVGTARYETRTDYNGSEKRITNDPQWPVGFLTIVAGVPVGIAGIVLGNIGNNKVRQYQGLLDGMSLELDPIGKGVRISYSF